MGGGQDWAQESYDQQRDEDQAIAQAFTEHRQSAESQLMRAAQLAELVVAVLLLVLIVVAVTICSPEAMQGLVGAHLEQPAEVDRGETP